MDLVFILHTSSVRPEVTEDLESITTSELSQASAHGIQRLQGKGVKVLKPEHLFRLLALVPALISWEEEI